MRPGYAHAIDVVPTLLDLLDLLGIATPKVVNGVAQSALEGTSFASHLADVRRR